MSDIFVQIDKVIRKGERLTFSITKEEKDGALIVALIQPIPADAPDNATPEIKQARAALSTCLRFAMTPADLDAEFARRVQGFASQRQSLGESYDAVIDDMNEANKALQAQRSSAGGKRGGVSKPTRSTPPVPAATSTSTAQSTETEEDDTDGADADETVSQSSGGSASKPATDKNTEMTQPLTLF